MAKEILAIAEEDLPEVIAVIRAGLSQVEVSEDVRSQLIKWCDDEEEYLSGEE